MFLFILFHFYVNKLRPGEWKDDENNLYLVPLGFGGNYRFIKLWWENGGRTISTFTTILVLQNIKKQI